MKGKVCLSAILLLAISASAGGRNEDLHPHDAGAGPVLRVACVGDSITFGSGLPDRERISYPILLQRLLGQGYEVRNFGVSGATLLFEGDRPWNRTRAGGELPAFDPNVVVIFLGTNDSKAANMSRIEGFEDDYRSLIDRFRKLPFGPRLILCAPVPAWTSGDGIDGGRIAHEIVPRVRRAASDHSCELIDLYTPMLECRGWFPDGVHPDPRGAEAIARRIYETMVLCHDGDYRFQKDLEKAGIPYQIDRFHGYPCVSFQRHGVSCRVACPTLAALGRPWIWRARFFGHEPQFDRAMLERGWHVAYCDTAGLFGAPEAVARWSRFYEFLVRRGLSGRPVLEAMSRGGLAAFNWAAKNPGRVAGIYADNPVCDARSWPGGFGRSSRRDAEWERCLRAYGLKEEEARQFPGFPVDGLHPMAREGVPLLHIIGAADRVVPPPENTDVVEARYRAMGGPIEVVRKPGLDHHPHSLPDPRPIVDFALRCTGRKVNYCTIPCPSVEWRGGSAGWGGGTWFDQHDAINRLGREHPEIGVVFLGDSITQNITGSTKRLAVEGGRRTFDRYYGVRRGAGCGISGDRTEHLLWRIRNGNFASIDPRLIVLAIGVNNINRGDTGKDVAAGIAAIVHLLQREEPQAKLLLLGCFPTGDADSWQRRQVDLLHEGIAPLADGKSVFYQDLRKVFLDPAGNPDFRLMREDKIHLSDRGTDAWLEAIEPTIRVILDESPEPAIEPKTEPLWPKGAPGAEEGGGVLDGPTS